MSTSYICSSSDSGCSLGRQQSLGICVECLPVPQRIVLMPCRDPAKLPLGKPGWGKGEDSSRSYSITHCSLLFYCCDKNTITKMTCRRVYSS